MHDGAVTNVSSIEKGSSSRVDVRVDLLITTLAAAGGAKGLHELIGRLQKAKEKAETAHHFRLRQCCSARGMAAGRKEPMID